MNIYFFIIVDLIPLVLHPTMQVINSIISYFQNHLFDFLTYSQLALLEERNQHQEFIQFDSKSHVRSLNKYLPNLPYHS